jgi:serine/threonine protein kinase/tetratricopeptide (TPR) repeat protein
VSPAQSGAPPGKNSGLPSRVGNYRIEERLGAGGMGVVYRAWDEALRRSLAIKHLPPGKPDDTGDAGHAGDTARRRFRREAQAAARLNHPAIVHIYEIIESEQGDWIVMELVEGETLSDLLAAGEISLLQTLRLAREIAEGLAEAHAHGVIHRDLKTNNVMVTKSGRAKILDFGVAKLPLEQEDMELSQTGMIIGTYHAMSPEQAMGLPLDPRSDLFSLGSLLYEMLTGTSPFRAGNAGETLARICSFRQPPARRMRAEIPQEVSDLIDQLLAKDPNHRPASAAEVGDALEAAADRLRSGAISGEVPSGLANVRPAGSVLLNDTTAATLVEGPALSRSAPSSSQSSSRDLSKSRRTIRERRQVTLAFCELTGVRKVDGLAIPTALDLEVVHEVLPEVRAAAALTAERFGGTVGDSMGHRLAFYFGYPQAHEDAAERAVRAVLELATQVEHLSADSTGGGELRLALRAAVHTGTAIVLPEPEQLTLGAMLDVTVGMLALAAPGEVLASTATQRLLKEAFSTEALPPVQIPGTGELIPVHRILEAGSATGMREQPVALVGRERELELLAGLWQKAAEGMGQVVLISGEAGMGKSHLVRALREKLGAGAQWLFCYGSAYASSSPLQPVVDLLRRMIEGGTSLDQSLDRPLERLEELLRASGLSPAEGVPLLASLLGVPLAGRYPQPELPPDRLRERILEMIAELALATAERQPLVWVFEDLHWLDPSTLRLLDLLLDHTLSAPLLLVLTVRPNTIEAMWGPRAHLTQLNLTPMSEQEVAKLIDRVAGRPLSEAVRRQIVARTDGVPLFVEELTKTVLEGGSMGESTEIPNTLRDSLAVRLDRIGTAKEIAQLASVLGRSFTFELLAAVSSLDEPTLQQELKRLVQAELLHRRGFGARTHYLFKHALIRDAAYDSLLRKERQQVHRRVAEALENLQSTQEVSPETLAYHYTEGNLPQKAVSRWLEAARQALGRSAYLETVAHVRSGLSTVAGLPPGPLRDEWELQLQTTLAPAMIAIQGHSSPEVERAYLRGLELCGEKGTQRFELLFGLFSFYAVQAKPDRAMPLAEEMLALAKNHGSRLFLVQSYFALGVASFTLGDFEASRRHMAPVASEDDPELARVIPLSFHQDSRKVGMAFDNMDLWHLGFPDQALERSRAALSWARDKPLPFTLTTCLQIAGFLHRFRREDAEVRRHAEEMLALSEEHGLFQVRDANVLLGLALAADQDGAAGIEHLKRSLEAYRATGFRVFLTFYLGELAAACLRLGRLDESRAVLDEAIALVHVGSEGFWEPELNRLDGELLLVSGRPEEAERAFRKALENAAGRSARSLELRAAVSLARLCQGQGRRDEAHRLLSGVYATFSEGFDTADLIEAGTLLAALA